MRRSVLLFGIICTIAATYLLYAFSTLIALLLEDCSNDAIHRSELPSHNSSLIDTPPQLIPKIIHQTYKNETIPEIWKDAQRSCITLHDDYEYILWTDAKAEDFIAREYPWFLETFKGYEYPIQRADSIRYFVLAHYGGIYIDLDDGCNRRLDPLLSYPAWLRRTSPTGISNDAMGSVPQHPFFLYVLDSLQAYNRHWLLPYVTVMYSTGPLFLSVIWKEWMSLRGPGESERVRVLMKDEYNRYSWSFFTYHKGSSWHGKDAQLVLWMGQNWMFLTVLGTLVVLAVGLVLFKCYARVIAIKGYLGAAKSALTWPGKSGAGVGGARGRKWSWCGFASFGRRGNESKARGGYYTQLPSTHEPSDVTSGNGNGGGEMDLDDDIAIIKEEYENRGRRRRSLAASSASTQSLLVPQYDEKQQLKNQSQQLLSQQGQPDISNNNNNNNNFTYTLTPSISNTSTVISESLPDNLQLKYPAIHHSRSNPDLHRHLLHPLHHQNTTTTSSSSSLLDARDGRDDSFLFPPSTATPAYPTQRNLSSSSSSASASRTPSSSRLQLPTLSSFLAAGRRLGSRSRDRSTAAAERRRARSQGGSGERSQGQGQGQGQRQRQGDEVCGLTGEDVEAQSVSVSVSVSGTCGGGGDGGDDDDVRR